MTEGKHLSVERHSVLGYPWMLGSPACKPCVQPTRRALFPLLHSKLFEEQQLSKLLDDA